MRSHNRGMDGVCRNVAAAASAVGVRCAVHAEGQLSTQNDVSGFHRMSVVSVAGVGPVLPDVGVRKTFTTELRDEFVLSHRRNSSARNKFRESRVETTAPSQQKWGLLQKGRAVFRREDR
jgi:hypothetical protein